MPKSQKDVRGSSEKIQENVDSKLVLYLYEDTQQLKLR